MDQNYSLLVYQSQWSYIFYRIKSRFVNWKFLQVFWKKLQKFFFNWLWKLSHYSLFIFSPILFMVYIIESQKLPFFNNTHALGVTYFHDLSHWHRYGWFVRHPSQLHLFASHLENLFWMLRSRTDILLVNTSIHSISKKKKNRKLQCTLIITFKK